MATVYGTLNDCSLGHLVGKEPSLVFTLNDPATSDLGLFVTDPIVATPNSAGAWSASLEPTDGMHQARWYSLSVRWLDAAASYVAIDYPSWRIRVPVGGGNIRDLVGESGNGGDGGWNPLMVFWQATEPDPWPVGAIWVNSITGDMNRKDA